MNKNNIILDSNVFIDFFFGGKPTIFVLLPGKLFITKEVYNEIKDSHRYVDQIVSEGRIFVLKETSPQNAEFQEIKSWNSALSDADITSLLATRKMGCLLLSGDRIVRETAKEKHLPIRGTLWAIEELFHLGAFSFQEVKIFYQKCLESKRRLPREEIEKQLKRFEKSER